MNDDIASHEHPSHHDRFQRRAALMGGDPSQAAQIRAILTSRESCDVSDYADPGDNDGEDDNYEECDDRLLGDPSSITEISSSSNSQIIVTIPEEPLMLMGQQQQQQQQLSKSSNNITSNIQKPPSCFRPSKFNICSHDVVSISPCSSGEETNSVATSKTVESFMSYQTTSSCGTSLLSIKSSTSSISDNKSSAALFLGCSHNRRREGNAVAVGDEKQQQQQHARQEQQQQQQQRHSILIIGANGRLGQECIQQFAQQAAQKPLIHGLVRDLKTMPEDHMEICKRYCENLVVGDATQAADLHRALLISRADTVLVCIGSHGLCLSERYRRCHDHDSSRIAAKTMAGNHDQSFVRTASARALVQVLIHPPFAHVRVICISSAAVDGGFLMSSSSSSSWLSQVGITGSAVAWKCLVPALLIPLGSDGGGQSFLPSDVNDHTGQEEVLQANPTIRYRTTFVRPTMYVQTELSVKANNNNKKGKNNSNHKRRLAAYKTEHKPPSTKTDRRDLAKWLVTETFYKVYQGRSVNVTSVC